MVPATGVSPNRRATIPYAVDLLSLHESDPERFPFLLESVATHPTQGRFDILFAEPIEEVRGDRTFLRSLDSVFHTHSSHGTTGPSFFGGWFLFLPYELGGEIEPSLRLPGDLAHPAAFALRIPAALVRDHVTRTAWAVADGEGAHLLNDLVTCATRAVPIPAEKKVLIEESSVWEEPAKAYKKRIRSAQRYISEGDIFQANLSRSWCATLKESIAHTDLYRALRRTNPAPFAVVGKWGEHAIVSSSPERLLNVVGTRVRTRPIAGTRPRGRDHVTDRDLSVELLSNEKERAEHVMLIDLERNDLGRICQAGSVQVDEFMVKESYAHVHHIVSNVVGELNPNVTPGEAIAAVFPGGTITGCPKVRCMEIIAELEREPRGVYTGSVGYLNHDGSMDLNILIRTFAVTGSSVTFRAGGGIVADSQPDQEVAETRAKAKGMLLALSERP